MDDCTRRLAVELLPMGMIENPPTPQSKIFFCACAGIIAPRKSRAPARPLRNCDNSMSVVFCFCYIDAARRPAPCAGPVWDTLAGKEQSDRTVPRDGECSMKFTILSHAGLLVEHAGVRVVCDPWLIGSCYWRSWWNFPEPDPALIADLRADFVYLTHLHWDHFHGPSLRRLFSPKTRMLVPKVPTRRMLEDLRYLGFENVVEIPHGSAFALASDFVLRSYQFGLGVDSAAVLAGGGTTLFNCNDAKFFGLPLKQILGDFPRIDFLLRSHSSAGPVPYCVENYERLPRDMLAQSDSADQFVRCALHVGARYAIPFASNHCFLHRDTVAFNGTATTPEEVGRHYRQVAASVASRTECVVMPPGSSWSDREGFRIQPFDFAARAEYIDSMLARHGGKLASRYAEEDRK